MPDGVTDDPGLWLLELYDSALPQVYGYLLPRCESAAVAEDISAETFLAAVDTVRRTAIRPSVPWLIGIARHKLADHWRAKEREQRKLEAVAALPEPAVDPWDVRLDVLRAEEVLQSLAVHHRAVLTLRYLDGLPVPEVARTLDQTVHATEALLTRAKAAFRKEYEGGAR